MPLIEVPEATPEAVAAVVAGVPRTAEDRLAETAREYGQYVAKQQIYSGDALIYNPGDPVPATAVERFRYHDAGYVAKVGTKDHREFENERRARLGFDPLSDNEDVPSAIPALDQAAAVRKAVDAATVRKSAAAKTAAAKDKS